MSPGFVPFLHCDLYKPDHSEKTYSELVITSVRFVGGLGV